MDKSDGIERESEQSVRDRQDKEKADAIRERQERLGHVPAESETTEEEN